MVILGRGHTQITPRVRQEITQLDVLRNVIMKQFLLLAAFVAAASAMPRYLVIPIEDVEFEEAPPPLPVVRFRRQAVQQDEEPPVYPVVMRRQLPPGADRRQDLAPIPVGPVEHQGGIPGSFINALQGANIPTAGDNLAAGSSSYHAPPQGADYVDYGGYDGKHGAFGWYTDHPVLLFKHH